MLDTAMGYNASGVDAEEQRVEMSEYQRNVAICGRCPFRQSGCEGTACACTADWVDIEDHARSGHCPQNLYPPRPKLAHGAAGIARAVAGAGGADRKLIEHRAGICGGCEQNQLSLGMIMRCKLCGCITWAKIRNVEEKCPAGKW